MVAKVLKNLNFSQMIRDGSVLAISGFNMGTTPDYLITQMLDYYIKNSSPKNLFIISDALPASPGRAFDNVMKYIYEENDTDLIRGMLVPFMGFSPYLQKDALEGIIPIYSWPIGLTAYWLREIASGRPGLLTKIGIDTYLDPLNEGGALNENAMKKKECRVREMKVDDERTLFYEGPKPDYAFIRASIADSKGNLSVRDEPFRGTIMNIAQAVKAHPNPGKVYAQVLRIMNGGYITPIEVEVPWPLVDGVVKSPPEYHAQASSFNFDPVCKGFFAVSTIPDMFSNYEGGIIDAAALGFLQVDQMGNVNPSILPGKITGPGGFPVIAQGSPIAIFMGKFMAGKMEVSFVDGKLKIEREGDGIKFVKNVYKILFSGRQASIHKKNVIYITERAVFELGTDGLVLKKVAPGIDMDRDILEKMEFRPKIDENYGEMEINL